MEYIEIFLNRAKEFFEQSQFTPQELLTLTVIGFICLYIILWIPIRGLRLWYWKSNKQLEFLKNIEAKLENIEHIGNAVPEIAGGDEPLPEELTPKEKQNTDEKGAEAVKPEVKAIPGYNVGRSGKVYSIEEIEMVIKD